MTAVTLTLAGLPPGCPRCPVEGDIAEWLLAVHGGLLQVMCPRCFTAVAPVHAVALPAPHYHDAAGDTPCTCPSPAAYAPRRDGQ